MEQSSWLAKANVQARHFAGKADLVCLHLSVVVQECISLIISATLMCKWTVALLHVISSKCRSSAAAGPSIMACVMHFMLASTPALCVDAACSLMHICLIAQAAFQSIKLDQLAPKPEFLIVHSTHVSCYPMIVCREGMGDEGGLAVASRRFLFTYDGQEYVWMKHRRFFGDNISCQNLSTGNVVAYYTNKMLPKKLQGILVIEPQVSSQDNAMSDYMIATHAAIVSLHPTIVLMFTHCINNVTCVRIVRCPFSVVLIVQTSPCSKQYGGKGPVEPDLQQSAVGNVWVARSGAGYEPAAYAGSWLFELSRMAGA